MRIFLRFFISGFLWPWQPGKGEKVTIKDLNKTAFASGALPPYIKGIPTHDQ